MSDLIDGVGTAAEGGLFARAIEPGSGARQRHPHQPENCLNCGTPLQGAYCHACGQQGHVHRTIGAFLHDLLHGALHFEGKLWRTLPMLVFRPGALTRRYIEGERARFVSPMALFLFSVFLMFAVFQLAGISAPTDLPSGDAVETTLEEARASARTEIVSLRERLANDDLSDAERTELEQELELFEALVNRGADTAPDELTDTIENAVEGPAPSSAAQEIDAGTEFALAGETGVTGAVLSEMAGEQTGVGWFDSAVSKWRSNPSLMLYKLQANAYKFSWMLIPLSIPFVWLLFAWKRRFKGYDHAIFVTYSLSFMTLLFIVMSLLRMAGVSSEVLVIVIATAGPLHLYKQLRGAYSLSRLSTIWRFLALSVFIWVIVGLFLQLLFLLGAF